MTLASSRAALEAASALPCAWVEIVQMAVNIGIGGCPHKQTSNQFEKVSSLGGFLVLGSCHRRGTQTQMFQ
jgi:hypothetical protein